MVRRLIATTIALGGIAVAAVASGAAAREPLYTLAATQSCLMARPDAVSGLPPTTPPVPPVLFVYTFAPGDPSISTARVHRQLGVWYGEHSGYDGVVLSFFGSAPAARASLKSLNGGELVRNVVATWDRQAPWKSVRELVLGCLRSGPAAHTAIRTPPPATLATFAGAWGGHTRGLWITSTGRGRENTDDGCCTRVYRLTFQIVSVDGTLTRATAVYRVTSFRRYEGGVRPLHAGEIGRLVLKNGIVTNTLTGDLFCSDPAWAATGACGA